jgi:hypothetical protein
LQQLFWVPDDVILPVCWRQLTLPNLLLQISLKQYLFRSNHQRSTSSWSISGQCTTFRSPPFLVQSNISASLQSYIRPKEKENGKYETKIRLFFWRKTISSHCMISKKCLITSSLGLKSLDGDSISLFLAMALNRGAAASLIKRRVVKIQRLRNTALAIH